MRVTTSGSKICRSIIILRQTEQVSRLFCFIINHVHQSISFFNQMLFGPCSSLQTYPNPVTRTQQSTKQSQHSVLRLVQLDTRMFVERSPASQHLAQAHDQNTALRWLWRPPSGCHKSSSEEAVRAEVCYVNSNTTIDERVVTYDDSRSSKWKVLSP